MASAHPRLLPQEASAEDITRRQQYEARLFERKTDEITMVAGMHIQSLDSSDTSHNLELIRFLGKGAFGQVWSSIDIASGEKRAVKVVSADKVDKVSPEDKLSTHATKAAGSNYVPHYFGSSEAMLLQTKRSHPTPPKAPFFIMVMEFVDGVNLDEAVRFRGVLKEIAAKVVCHDICLALKRLHECHMIHNDVKPANILLHSKGAKLCDFGVSQIVPEKWHGMGNPLEGGGMRFPAHGTLMYMAPEKFLPSHDDKTLAPFDYKVDTWALGITTIFMVTGEIPNATIVVNGKTFPNPQEQFIQRLRDHEEEPPILEDFPGGKKFSRNFRDFVRGLLQFWPDPVGGDPPLQPEPRLTAQEAWSLLHIEEKDVESLQRYTSWFPVNEPCGEPVVPMCGSLILRDVH